MNGANIKESAAATRWAVRHPVLVDTDGDFALDSLFAVVGANTPPQTSHQRDPDGPARIDSVDPAEAAALHAFETSRVFEPPVGDRTAHLTPQMAAEWLGTASRWIAISGATGDLRYLNCTCKLLGAVWVQYNRRQEEFACLASELAATASALERSTGLVSQKLSRRLQLLDPGGAAAPTINPVSPDPTVRICILAGVQSRTADRLVSAAAAAGIPITAVCRYAPTVGDSGGASNYASAWYPPGAATQATVPVAVTAPTVMSTATWEEVEQAVRGFDLVLLAGMPIIPRRVLEVPRLGIVNAHNGILPAVRGMDAVGWAILHNQPIVCTLHMARPQVDAGEVLATQPVPVAPTATLAERVKTTQLRLLLGVAAHVASTGELPDATPQLGSGTQYYRMHPHLKRVLDGSCYGG